MRNLLLPDKGYMVFYALLWLACTLAHFALCVWQFELGLQASALDAAVTQTSLFVLLIPLWFVARLQQPGKPLSVNNLGNALMAILLLLGLWYSAVTMFGHFAYPDPKALYFVRETLVFRIIFGALTAFVVYGSLLAYRMLEHTRRSEKRQAELENLVQQTELQALKNQLNPHFIYNSLNAISSLTLTDPEKAREMVIRLSDFLRYALRRDALQLGSLEEELQAVERYLQIEKVRFGERMICKMEVEEGLGKTRLPGLILQPLFENAVKHGVQQQTGPVVLDFRALASGEDVLLEIRNQYDPRFARFRGEGVGLENVRNRLRLHYGNGRLLHISASDNLFTASLRIPANLPEEGLDEAEC